MFGRTQKLKDEIIYLKHKLTRTERTVQFYKDQATTDYNQYQTQLAEKDAALEIEKARLRSELLQATSDIRPILESIVHACLNSGPVPDEVDKAAQAGNYYLHKKPVQQAGELETP